MWLSGLMNWRTPEGSITFFHASRYFSFGGSWGCFHVRRCWAGFEFSCFLPFYLCRAARGSADIPILPHSHTILLKHAVNLRRKRVLFISKRLFHHPIVMPASRCHMNIGFSQKSGAEKRLRPDNLSAFYRMPQTDFVNWALSSTLGAVCRRKNVHFNGDSP